MRRPARVGDPRTPRSSQLSATPTVCWMRSPSTISTSRWSTYACRPTRTRTGARRHDGSATRSQRLAYCFCRSTSSSPSAWVQSGTPGFGYLLKESPAPRRVRQRALPGHRRWRGARPRGRPGAGSWPQRAGCTGIHQRQRTPGACGCCGRPQQRCRGEGASAVRSDGGGASALVFTKLDLYDDRTQPPSASCRRALGVAWSP